MHKKFDHNAIEKKWQDTWEKSGIFDVGARDHAKEKKYILVEFPYPSGNLHIGHWFAFAVVDIYVRALRMQGKQVFFPIGFDSFGLPAENAAIKRGLNPKDWTYDNIAYMTQQLKSMGNAFAWNASLRTSDPEYYGFTQHLFTEFFKHDLVYRGTAIVNWDPVDKTVVANEQVLPDGTGERSGAKIEKREMPQWMMRITKYADRLIDDLDTLPWPNHIKESQKNWIGRSEGATLDFALTTGEVVPVFTTRPETIFGATYIVLAPEHPLVAKNKDIIKNWNEVSAYCETARHKDDIERIAEKKEKTGVALEGIKAFNPATKLEIPVYVAEYVLSQYGTGAIMAVPAHDTRDYAFAQTFSLPVVPVIKTSEPLPYAGNGPLIHSGAFDGLNNEEAKQAIVEHLHGKLTKTYRLRDWSVGRQRYWGVPIPIVYDPQGTAHPIPKEHLPWLLPVDVDFTPTGVAPLAKSAELKERTEKIFGKGWTPEVETMDTFVDSSWHFLRYTDVQNTNAFASLEAQKDWMPVDIYFGGAEHTTMHLLYSRFWQKALFDLGLATEPEPYTMRINRGLVLGPDGNKMSKSKGNVIDPDIEVTRLGADTVKMYLAFMGPYAETSNYPWDMGGIAGLRRFLERAHGLVDHVRDLEAPHITVLLNQTIEKMTNDIALYKFNTAISALMVFINSAEKDGLSRASYQIFVRLLAPFAPHLTEELWSLLGESTSIHEAAWPIADQTVLQSRQVTMAVQIDGKTRGTVTVPMGSDEATVMAAVRNDAALERYLESLEQPKVIFVVNKIINVLNNRG